MPLHIVTVNNGIALSNIYYRMRSDMLKNPHKLSYTTFYRVEMKIWHPRQSEALRAGLSSFPCIYTNYLIISIHAIQIRKTLNAHQASFLCLLAKKLDTDHIQNFHSPTADMPLLTQFRMLKILCDTQGHIRFREYICHIY